MSKVDESALTHPSVFTLPMALWIIIIIVEATDSVFLDLSAETLREKEILYLFCTHSESNTNPQIVILKDGNDFLSCVGVTKTKSRWLCQKETKSTTTVVLRDLRVTDSGIYQCQVVGEGNSNTANFTVLPNDTSNFTVPSTSDLPVTTGLPTKKYSPEVSTLTTSNVLQATPTPTTATTATTSVSDVSEHSAGGESTKEASATIITSTNNIEMVSSQISPTNANGM